MDLNSTTLLYGLVAGMLPPLLWLWFWLKEDNLHDEPRITLAGCFIGGMLAVFVVSLLEVIMQQFVPNIFNQYIWIAAIEECVKLAMAYAIVFRNQKMHEPVDAMIYMITVGLGFAAVENTFFMFGFLNGSSIISTIAPESMRFIGPILIHIICCAVIGFMLATTFYHGKWLKFTAGIVGLALAIALHAAFDLAIITSNAVDTLKIFAWVWAGVIVVILLFEEAKGIELKHRNLKTNQTQ